MKLPVPADVDVAGLEEGVAATVQDRHLEAPGLEVGLHHEEVVETVAVGRERRRDEELLGFRRGLFGMVLVFRGGLAVRGDGGLADTRISGGGGGGTYHAVVFGRVHPDGVAPHGLDLQLVVSQPGTVRLGADHRRPVVARMIFRRGLPFGDYRSQGGAFVLGRLLGHRDLGGAGGCLRRGRGEGGSRRGCRGRGGGRRARNRFGGGQRLLGGGRVCLYSLFRAVRQGLDKYGYGDECGRGGTYDRGAPLGGQPVLASELAGIAAVAHDGRPSFLRDRRLHLAQLFYRVRIHSIVHSSLSLSLGITPEVHYPFYIVNSSCFRYFSILCRSLDLAREMSERTLVCVSPIIRAISSCLTSSTT